MGGRARRQRGAGLGGVVVAEVDSLERAEPGGRRRRKIRAREMTVAELADEVEGGEAEAGRRVQFSAGRWPT